MDTDFDWTAAERDLPTIREQLLTAIYPNTDGDLVIRQRDWPEDDSSIIIARNNVEQLVRAICEMMGIDLIEMVAPQRALPAPDKPSTAAERQRRYRERQRNGVTLGDGDVTDSVTPRDGEQRALGLDVAAE